MVQQKYLSMPAMVAFITFMNMFIPLSTDLYLPALPEMGGYFSVSQSLVSLTLTVFFFVFAVSIVVFGPLSDKYGRKPILVFGAALFSAASLVCALSGDIYTLIAGRFFQAVGSGAVITVATALIKDCFYGRVMTRILAITQALAVIAPMAAPIIGGLLLQFTTWRGAFYLLTALGIVNLVLSLLFTETLARESRFQGRVAGSLMLLWEQGKQKRFMLALVMFSLLAAPYMAYLSVSSFVYIETFHLSAQQYSYFFAANSFAAVIGPACYLRMKQTMSNSRILFWSLAVALASGLLVMFAGPLGAFCFLLSFLPFTVIESVIRPFSMDILLNEARENAGTASSMINFVHTLFGSVGMMLGTLPWENFVVGLALIMLGATMLAIALSRFVRGLGASEVSP